MTCPKCGGAPYSRDDELVCRNCGVVVYQPRFIEQPPVDMSGARELFERGESVNSLADIFGMSAYLIGKLRDKEGWQRTHKRPKKKERRQLALI